MEATEVKLEWEQTPELGELFKALAAAQGEMENASKSKDNPFFKSKYADLAAIKDVTQGALTKYALAVTSQNFTRGAEAGVRTMIGHGGSGQWMACVCTTVPKDKGPQAMGSCWSYLRRYSKSALLDIATEDDDGEKAEGRDRDKKPPGANWGKPANQPRAADPRDPGEAIDEATLHELRSVALAKFPKKPAEAKGWLKEHYGTEDPSKLTKFEATEAIRKLQAA